MEFLTGKDYPRLCPYCRQVIDDVAGMFQGGDMPDTDDNEAPCMYVYDHKLFCGGTECENEENNVN